MQEEYTTFNTEPTEPHYGLILSMGRWGTEQK